MKDLSNEERLEQQISKLEQKVVDKAYAYGDRKWLRIKRTFFAISGVIYLIELCFALAGGTIDITIDVIFGFLFAPLIAAGFIMLISLGVWSYVLDKTVNERIEIAKLEGELNAIKSKKYNNLEDKKIKELKKQIEYLENFKEQLIEENTYLKLNKVFDRDAE